LLIASILTAALGTALIWLYVQGADARAQQTANLVPALFLRQSVEGGKPVNSTDVVAKQVTPAAAEGALTDLSQVTGKTLTQSLPPNTLLQPWMFSSQGGGRLEKGLGAVSISINDPDRVPADLRPGDTVAVYSVGGSKLQLEVPEIKVRSIGSALVPAPASAPGAAPAAGAPAQGVAVTIVGFDATPDQAVTLLDIKATGKQAVIYILGQGTKAKPAS
jgi:pilus assembly protein CpaB